MIFMKISRLSLVRNAAESMMILIPSIKVAQNVDGILEKENTFLSGDADILTGEWN